MYYMERTVLLKYLKTSLDIYIGNSRMMSNVAKILIF